MKKHIKLKKFLKYTFIIVVILNIFLNSVPDCVFARVNTEYGSQTSEPLDYNDEFESKSELWKYLGMLIYAIGNAIEWLFQTLLGILSGDYSFPWADRIIFNAIPLLDVNFIASSPGSLFTNAEGSPTVLNTAVQTVYFTILAIALSFMGIVVAIMAIKIILSNIASEKAKYKESIVNWIFAMVMVFSMHFVLSFVFYINEQLTYVASQIFENAITQSGLADKLADIQNAAYGNQDERNQEVEDFAELNWNTMTISQLLNIDNSIDEESIQWWGNEVGIHGDKINLEGLDFNGDPCIAIAIYRQFTSNTYCGDIDLKGTLGYLLNNSQYRNVNRVKNSNNEGLNFGDVTNFAVSHYQDAFVHAWQDGWMVAVALKESDDVSQCVEKLKSFDLFKKENSDEQNALITVLQDIKGGGKASSNVISEMAEYFKNISWTQEKSGNKFDTPNLIGVSLYAIFVVQSVLFFIAYLKRFFYVVVLSMFAPIIVIYDFFTKSLI